MALRKIRQTWYVYYRDGGTIRTKSLRVHTRTEAERLHDLYMEALRVKRAETALRREFGGAFPVAPSALQVPPAAPEEAIAPARKRLRISAMWDLAVSRRRLSDSHRKIWEAFAARSGLTYADQCTPAAALAYLERHYAAGNGKTWNNVKSALSTVFRQCLVEAGLPASPFRLVPQKLVETVEKHRNLTGEEFDRLFRAASPQLQVLLMLSRWTTQRLETCARMTPEQFDFSRLVFTIEPGKTARFGKWVCVPIMPELEAYLRPILAQCPPGKPIAAHFGSVSNAGISQQCRRLIRSLGIPDTAAGKASFHSVRGTAITWYKEHGVKGEELRAITGHETSDVEDVYARDIASLETIARASREASK
ncbi:MAG: site-specific integrase [Clostridia bacterium]|nr:site-specific integrase [Lentisphaeria bacterium]MBR0422938.1 site-specific integrase [Clostridia bacterium]